MRDYRLLLAGLGLLICLSFSYGMATMEVGPDSVRGHPTTAQPDWPVGLVELPRHESRVYSVWINGWESFYFKATPEEVNELILLFSKTRMRDHELRIKDRKQRKESLGTEKYDYNVQLEVVGGIARHLAKQAEEASTHEPTLTLYIDPSAAKGLAETLKLPDNIIMNNELAGLSLKGKATKPQRDTWYARAQFDDSTPAADFQHGVSTQVAVWEKNAKEGIKLGKIDNKGTFRAAFSEREIADLKAGRSWLTLTVGNWLTEPKSDDPKMGWKSLSRDQEKAEAVTVAKPRLYYGRILFEDGSPVTSGSSLGREITVSFSYAGIARVDANGYIQVCFTGDQYETAKAKREGKNIYIPTAPNQGTALYVFPVSKLSQDKEKAGVVRIPRPGQEEDRRTRQGFRSPGHLAVIKDTGQPRS